MITISMYSLIVVVVLGTFTIVTPQTTYNIDWFIPAQNEETDFTSRDAQVGDTFDFVWSTGTHDVHIHPTGDCSTNDRITVGSVSGSTSYTFQKEDVGVMVFACDIGYHCEAGQLIQVTVRDTTTTDDDASSLDETTTSSSNDTNSETTKTEYGEKNKKEAASIFSMEYLPIGHLRTDPIISQDCLSDHVHTFYGPPKIHPSVTYQELRSTTDTTPHEAVSGNVLENQSLYWHPSFYRVQPDGMREIVEPDWTTVYYAFNKGETKAFPEGFRMITYLPEGLKLSCYSDEQFSYQDAKAKTENDKANAYEEAKAKAYEETKANGYDKDSDHKHTDTNIDYKNVDKNKDYNYTDTYDSKNANGSHFPSTPCEELAASVVFPTCWDGVNVDSDNHRSHVVYSSGKESGNLGTFGGSDFTCPESHPVLLPQILLFLRFANYPGGSYELSNGDGADWHADYIMGWDESFLQDILDDVDCPSIKDVPCGATRLRNLDGTGSKKQAEPSWVEMAETLRQVRVPMVNTACITDEAVNQIKILPRGDCMGNVNSVDSCAQPEFPAHLKVDANTKDNQMSTAEQQRTVLLVLVGSVIYTIFAVV